MLNRTTILLFKYRFGMMLQSFCKRMFSPISNLITHWRPNAFLTPERDKAVYMRNQSELSAQYEVVVGIEVHAQLSTQSKMFCRCSTAYAGSPPNTCVCPVCLGLPGALPVINKAAVVATMKTGLALHCTIPETAVFARKNYTYPDLPKGYQITQFEHPSCEQGWLEIELPGGETKRIGIRRAHLEEDTGRTVHDGAYSYVDLNRAGVPLMEIVSEADINSAEEAYAYLTQLRTILRYLGVNSGDMEKGALRCEPNISVRTLEQKARGLYGTKVEVKNLNSFRAVRNAIAYEMARQIEVLEAGGTVEQVNMGWDEQAQQTVLQRGKEDSHDYRYFPEPDLPPLHVDAAWVESIAASLPELPGAKSARYQHDLGLRKKDAEVLTSEQGVAEYFEAVLESYGETDGKAQQVANWISGEFFRLIYADGEGQDLRQIADIRVRPEQLAELLTMVDSKVITANSAKKTLEWMFESGEDAAGIVAREGLALVSDSAIIDDAIQAVVTANADAVARYRGGEEKLLGFFMGQIMRATRGKADPDAARQRLLEKLQP